VFRGGEKEGTKTSGKKKEPPMRGTVRCRRGAHIEGDNPSGGSAVPEEGGERGRTVQNWIAHRALTSDGLARKRGGPQGATEDSSKKGGRKAA